MIPPSARADLYRFFSRLFLQEIDDAFASSLQGPLAAELLPAFAESEERTAVLDPAVRASRFDVDFTHLTVVNLTPYESFFRREDAQIEAGLNNPLVRFYRAHGYTADLEAARALSPDHIGIELEFLALLAQTEARASSEGREDYATSLRKARATFLYEHLGAWAFVYLLAVERNAKTVLYREGAEALLEWILTDASET